MNFLTENSTSKLLEEYLGVENLRFREDMWEDRDVYFGKHIKRGPSYRKEDTISYKFPKYIFCSFTKNSERLGIKIKTKDFVVGKGYSYRALSTVDIGDGIIRTEKPIFGDERPMLLPYLFIGNKYQLDTNRIAEYLKEKIC